MYKRPNKKSSKRSNKKSSKRSNKKLSKRILEISLKTARYYGDKFDLNWDLIPLKWWKYGLEVELEHGTKLSKITNITRDNIEITAKIALAHLIEYPDYYQRLKEMENEAEKYWKRKKFNVFKV